MLIELDVILLSVVNQETGLRAFLLAGDDAFLEPYHTGTEAFDAAIGTVRTLTSDNPRAQQLVDELEAAGLGWRMDHAEVAIGLMRDPATVTAAVEMEISGAGKAQMDALRTLVEEFVAMESGLLEGRKDDLHGAIDSGQSLIVASIFGAVLLTVLALFAMLRLVDRPLRDTAAAIKRLTSEDIEIEIPHAHRRDEVGQIALGLADYQQVAQQEVQRVAQVERAQLEQERVVQVLGDAIGRMAQLDLTYRIAEDDFPAEFAALRQSYNDLATALTDAIFQLGSESQSVTSQAAHLSDSANSLAQRAENQAATLEEAAAAIEEISRAIDTSAEIAREAENKTQENQSVAKQAGDTVEEAVRAMQRIEQKSVEITQITSVIDDISFQTNLLALNAGVEAALTGEAGKGFAVVASEVRQLAQRSSESARQIKELISSSSEEVAAGSALVSQTGTALKDILNRAGIVTGKIKDLSSANQEQSHGIREVNVGMQELDKVTQHNAGMAQKMLGSSKDMTDVAASMQRVLQRFATVGAETKVFRGSRVA